MREQLTFTAFYDDMTFFSWMSMMQVQNGTTNARELSKALFGNISSGLRTDFPSNLSYFCQQTSYIFGSEFDIARYRTTLPYYTTFKDETYLRACIGLMSSNSVETLKFHLGLPPSNLNTDVPLKFCMQCYLNDIASHGFGYWHRVHQLPTSYTCPKHGETLEYQAIREDGRGRSMLVLPNEHLSRTIIFPENTKSVLLRLSVLTEKILQITHSFSFNDRQLFHTYRHGLKEQGFLTKRGLIRASEFIHKFENYYSSIKSIQPYNNILGKYKTENLLKLLRKPRGCHHTAEHILMIDFLFGSWELFISTYRWESQFQFDFYSESTGTSEKKVDSVIDEIVSRYERGESLSSLCREKVLDIGTVMRHIKKDGLTKIRKRPKSLTQGKIDEVLILLNEGKSISEIVTNTQLSKSTIDRICSENQEAWQAWNVTKKERIRDERRQLLTNYLLMNATASVADVRGCLNKEYKWLSTHDSEWLNNFVKKLNKKTKSKTFTIIKTKVDWEARDLTCLNILQTLGKLEFESWERKKPQAFLRRLPKFDFKPRLERLPKSSAWIQDQINLLNEAL